MPMVALKLAYDSSGITCPGSAKRGIGRYALSHLRATLANFPDVKVTVLMQGDRDYSWSRDLNAYGNVEFVDWDKFDQTKCDVLHLPDPMSLVHDSVGRLLESVDQIPVTILFHDLIPLMMHQWHFDQYDYSLARAYLDRLTILKERVSYAFTNSESTRDDLVRVTQFSDHKCGVVYAGTSLVIQEFEKDIYNLEGKYFMVVGGLESHKGFDLTLKSFLNTVHHLGAELLIVGEATPYHQEVYSQALRKADISSVRFTGFISDHELARLYSRSIGLIFPSQYEGFGFPVLEAMSCGCPVVTCRNSSLAEVGGDVALYIEDRPLEKWMMSLFYDDQLVKDLRVKGHERARNFTWDRVASLTIKKWQELI
jgi:glycosyltransferase involved in cell wall biosynthesis